MARNGRRKREPAYAGKVVRRPEGSKLIAEVREPDVTELRRRARMKRPLAGTYFCGWCLDALLLPDPITREVATARARRLGVHIAAKDASSASLAATFGLVRICSLCRGIMAGQRTPAVRLPASNDRGPDDILNRPWLVGGGFETGKRR